MKKQSLMVFNGGNNAFTLAEVLITLGIIGIVAALTLPTLIANHRKQVVETRLAKFYSVMNQAVKRAEVDYGDASGWEPFTQSYEQDENGNNDITKPIPNTDYFNKYFAPYLASVEIKTKQNSGLILVYFQDGSAATFSPGSVIFYVNAKDLKIIDKGDGTFGQDKTYEGTKSFVFYHNPTNKSQKYHYGKGMEPYKSGWDGTEDKLRNNNTYGCKQQVSAERAYCTALIQLHGWKIPNDYPLKF